MSPARLRRWRKARAIWLFHRRAREPPPKPKPKNRKRHPGQAGTALPKSNQPVSKEDYFNE